MTLMLTCRCPPLLTIHVKRFQQDMRGRLSKLAGRLPFTLGLDLHPFCDPKVPIPRLFPSVCPNPAQL